jgi:hypothetical protein
MLGVSMERVDINLTLNLPIDIAQQAESAGLLNEAELERMIAEELVRRRRVDRLFANLDKLAELEPSLTEDEIGDEIEQYRREKREQR